MDNGYGVVLSKRDVMRGIPLGNTSPHNPNLIRITYAIYALWKQAQLNMACVDRAMNVKVLTRSTYRQSYSKTPYFS